MEKDYNEFKIHNSQQSLEEVLIERVVRTTTQILYDKGLFDNYDNADEVLKDGLLIDEANERRTPDLVELKDDVVIRRCRSQTQFVK